MKLNSWVIEIDEAENGYFAVARKMSDTPGVKGEERRFVEKAPQALADNIAKLLKRPETTIRPWGDKLQDLSLDRLGQEGREPDTASIRSLYEPISPTTTPHGTTFDPEFKHYG